MFFRVVLPAMIVIASANPGKASVILNGTRIVMDRGATEKSIQFTNKDSAPYIIQISTFAKKPHEATVALIAVPQIFRIDPNSGQTVKIKLLEPTLPQNRESLFYLEFSQFPTIPKKDVDKNKLFVVVKSRIKVIYRPDSLQYSPSEVEKNLRFRVIRDGVKFLNHSPFYISIRNFSLQGQATRIHESKNLILPPYDSIFVSLKQHDLSSSSHWTMSVSAINDYGIDDIVSIQSE